MEVYPISPREDKPELKKAKNLGQKDSPESTTR
jgi:hypothetical protein